MNHGLKDYTTLGRTGLRVSPLCLGTMTFGTEWSWGSEEDVARAICNRYLEEGGNFLDTADVYTGGTSEKMVGKFLRERSLRDRVVLASKFTMNTDAGNPNGCGNGRKNIYRALEKSLQRLQTDYLDLYWLHAWDAVTPVEEVVSTLDDLVREGKIRHYGFSDTPAWYFARAYTLAEKEGRDRLAALQLEYSLVERNIEREHIPAAQELGIAVCPWSPLAGGFLSGKYRRTGESGSGEGRLDKEKTSGRRVFNRFIDRNWRILEVLLEVAQELQKSPAQVALNWLTTQPGVTSVILGATRPEQLEANLAAVEFEIPPGLRKQLDQVSAIDLINPYTFLAPPIKEMVAGGHTVEPWAPAKLPAVG
jgi:aryl-alcohol dehydrogenase-like predicted oxidoreductase